MSLATAPKGTDITLQFVLAQDAVPLDLTNATEIEVKVYQRKDDVLATFLLSDSEVVVTDATAGECECYLNRESLDKIRSGRLFTQIFVTIPNADFANGEQVLGITDILSIEIVDKA